MTQRPAAPSTTPTSSESAVTTPATTAAAVVAGLQAQGIHLCPSTKLGGDFTGDYETDEYTIDGTPQGNDCIGGHGQLWVRTYRSIGLTWAGIETLRTSTRQYVGWVWQPNVSAAVTNEVPPTVAKQVDVAAHRTGAVAGFGTA